MSENLVQKLEFNTLTADQIESVIKRFEAAFEKGEVVIGKKGCLICQSESRPIINRRILQGGSWWELAESLATAVGARPSIKNHFINHLLPLMGKEIEVRLMDLATRTEANKRFPINAPMRRQIAWCIGQFMVARKLLVENIDRLGMQPLKRAALNDFVKVVGEIRDTAMFLHGRTPGKKKMSDDLSQEIEEETRKAIEHAREQRKKYRKPIEVKNEQQRQGSVGEDHQGEGQSSTANSAESGTQA